MFGGDLKQKHQLALSRLYQFELEELNLHGELNRLKRERDALRAELEAAQVERQVMRKIYENMQSFGVSLVGQQARQAMAEKSLRSFVEVAKLDHILYKFEIYKVFMGVSGRNADDFASHTACRLGKWYFEGEGKVCFSRLDGYATVDKPHQEFHQYGREAVAALRSGNPMRGMELVGKLEASSLEVISALERIAVAGEGDSSVLCHTAK